MRKLHYIRFVSVYYKMAIKKVSDRNQKLICMPERSFALYIAAIVPWIDPQKG
jgi:hypothetical protein